MKREIGTTFIETAVALAVLGVVAVAFLSGLATASTATIIVDEKTTAESLMRSQTEGVKKADYVYDASSYPAVAIPALEDYADYSVNITAEAVNQPDDGIQKITITIKHRGEPVISLDSYKVDR